MKTSAKLEKEIVVRRTGVNVVCYDNGQEQISIRLLVYIPGEEDGVYEEFDEETWDYSSKDCTWWDLSSSRKSMGSQVGLEYFLGANNKECIIAVLEALRTQEFITIKYTIGMQFTAGHSLSTCSECKHWNAGYCRIEEEDMPGDKIIPCRRGLFRPKQ